jgi:imidazolonepropionase-like amidohydrolase
MNMIPMKLFFLLLTLCAPAFAEVLVLKNFTLIDGAGRPAAPNSAMIVDNGRISWIGPAAQLKVPAGAVTQDYAGKFVMPGIINLHGHVAVAQGLDQDPVKYFTPENVQKSLHLYATYGVTTVQSMGTDQPVVWQIRDQQRAGRPSVTRIYTAGRGFTGAGGYPTPLPGMKDVPFQVSTPEQAAADVRELAPRHPDVVKIWVDDHLGKYPKIKINLSKAIIDAAHKDRLHVAAHIFYLQDAKELAAAGLDGFAHSVRDKPVDDELVRLMKQHGTWQMAATLAREAAMFSYAKTPAFASDPFFTRGLAPDVLATIKGADYQKRIQADPDFAEYPKFLDMAKANTKRLFDAGIKFGFGSDSGPPARFPGWAEHWEMQLLVEAGLTPVQVITMATKNGAEWLGAKDLGTLEKGKWADLLVLDADPLANILNTRKIAAVYVAGNMVR